MAGSSILVIIAVSIAVVIVLISVFKINAFISLIVTALVLALATGKSGAESVALVTTGFGNTMGSSGLIIVFGIIIGYLLEKTGGAEKIAVSVLRVVGEAKALLAMCITGGIVSIPVFSDSGFLILWPVAKSLSRRGKIPIFSLVTGLMLCLVTTHCLVPPTPGPIAAAGILGADLGWVIIYGLCISIPTIYANYLFVNSRYIKNKFPAYITDENVEMPTFEEEKSLFKDGVSDGGGYSTFSAYLPIVIPILLIVVQSFSIQYLPADHTLNTVFGLIGRPVVALFIGICIVWTITRKYKNSVRRTWIEKAIDGTAMVMLITAAGGAYGTVIRSSGVSEFLSGTLATIDMPGIVFPFLISVVMLTATGSSTVALTTTAAIISPVIGSLGISPELAVIAIASGAASVMHVNASMFWLIQRLCGFDMRTTTWCFTVGSMVLGAAAFASTYVLSLFVS